MSDLTRTHELFVKETNVSRLNQYTNKVKYSPDGSKLIVSRSR